MPQSEKKAVRDSKTKAIQKINKKNTHRKQKTKKLLDDSNPQKSPIIPNCIDYERLVVMPHVQDKKQKRGSSNGEIQIAIERQKSYKNDSLQSKNEIRMDESRQNFRSNYEWFDSNSSNKSQRTLSEKSYDQQLGFVVDDNDQTVSESLGSIPQTPVNQDCQMDEVQPENIECEKPKLKLQAYIKAQQTFSTETLDYLVERQRFYKVSKIIFDTRHPEITSKNRQILIDWLMDVSDKFQLKSQTFHLSVNFADRYLMKVKDFELDHYQKLGITCLLMACKIEEIYYPKHIDFQSITDDNCSLEEILELETEILNKLNWLVNPPTLNYWANYYMMLWDQYAQQNPLGLFILQPSINTDLESLLQIDEQSKIQKAIPLFKSDDNKHYLNFRHVMQTLDLALMDIDHYYYDPRHLSIASIVIILALNFNKLKLDDIINLIEQQKYQIQNQSSTLQQNQQQSNYQPNLLNNIYESIVCQEYDEFSHLLINFIETSCDVRVTDISQSLRYIMLFYTVPLQTQMPCKLQDEQASTQEEFFSYQVCYKDLEKIQENIKTLKQQLQFT
eukprot:403354617